MTGPAGIERVIVVDDDPVIRGILRSTLAGIGLGVHVAADGAAAVTMAARFHAGLFILDLQMPGTNGIEVCRQLRAMPRYSETPIVVLTGHNSPRTQSVAQAAGVSLFLTKPFKPAALLQILGPILNGEVGPAGAMERALETWSQSSPDCHNQFWGRQ